MREFAGKTTFVTGRASGIGFAPGQAFTEAGMKVMLADIETDALAAAVKRLRDATSNVRGVACDVADPASAERAAAAAFEAFMWFATRQASPAGAALTISRSTIGVGWSTPT